MIWKVAIVIPTFLELELKGGYQKFSAKNYYLHFWYIYIKSVKGSSFKSFKIKLLNFNQVFFLYYFYIHRQRLSAINKKKYPNRYRLNLMGEAEARK